MRKRLKKFLLVLAIASPIAGCNSLSDTNLFTHSRDALKSGNGFVTQTQAGRAELSAGRPDEAIWNFQRALMAGEPMAPAFNGMGVAYIQLGRPDLAQRFFEQAIASDPGNMYYRANLTKLTGLPVHQDREDCGVDRRPTANGSLAVRELGNQSTTGVAPLRDGQLQRVSRAEVRIVSGPARPAPLAMTPALASRGDAGVVGAGIKNFKPIVRIAFSDVQTSRPDAEAQRGLVHLTAAGDQSGRGVSASGSGR